MELKDIKKPDLYSMVETASFMKIGYTTLYRMVKCGKIKAMNVAKTGTKPIYAFRPNDIQEYYNSIGEGHPEGDHQPPDERSDILLPQ